MTSSKKTVPTTRLKTSILRSSRPEVARDFYNALLGPHTTILGSELNDLKSQTCGIIVETPTGADSRWFPHASSSDLALVHRQVRELGGTYHEDSSLLQNQVVTAPDHSQIIVTDSADDPDPAANTGPNVMLELCTREIEASSAFYTGILDLEQVPVPQDPYGYRVFFAGDTGIAGAVDMTPLFRDTTKSHWIPYFHVDDVDAKLQEAVAYGARVTVPPNDSMFDTRYAIFVDPIGATFGLRKHPRSGIFGTFSREHGQFLKTGPSEDD